MATIKKTPKAQAGKKIPTTRINQVADSLDNKASQKMQASMSRTVTDKKGYDSVAKELNRQAGKDSDNATRYRSIANAAEKKAKMKKYATGGPVPKTAKKPVSTIDKVKKGVSKLTMKDVKDSAESALNLSTLGGYGVAKKKVKELTGMKNGGSLTGLKASNKRAGSVDPKGAFTKVQKKTLSGAKGKASLTKDKQLGATKMKNGGCMSCGGKMSKKK